MPLYTINNTLKNNFAIQTKTFSVDNSFISPQQRHSIICLKETIEKGVVQI